MDWANRETSRDYANPHRPPAIRAFNWLGRGVGRTLARAVGQPIDKPFDPDALIATAVHRSGSDRFATETFRPALHALIDSLHAEANLTPMGRFMTGQHFVQALANNLRAGALFAANPTLRTRPLARTVMVCGLARSGTTLLQRLIAELPGARSVPAWEAFEPIPEDIRELRPDPSTDGRVKRLKIAERMLRWLSPDMFAVHPMDAMAPEEDVIILENVFHSQVSESTYHVPSFARWLEQQDQRPAYEWLADCMRVMAERQTGAFWVLKSPNHLEWLDTVFEVFPDVTIVQTHRDPIETVPSFCSLVGHGWGIMSDTVDPLAVSEHWTRKIDRMLTRAMASRDAREARGLGGFVDVHYADLVADPIGVVERLAAQVGLPWDETSRPHLSRWLTHNKQHRYGIHRYAAADFGLSDGVIAERFMAYRQRFGMA